jgi:hypothetical protein
MLLARETFGAKLVTPRNPLDGVLDAELVAIVKQAGPDAFAVEQVFLGTVNPGDVIALADFKLFTAQENGPDLVEASTENTRILMFLQRDTAKTWELTWYKDCFFWVQDRGQVFQLENMAKRALQVRHRWEQAAQIAEPRERVRALWEFVFPRRYSVSFFEHTMAQLRKAGIPAGDYIAEQFDGMSWNDRSLFYNEAGAYDSEKLHQKLIGDLRRDQGEYEAFVLTSGWDPKDIFSHWNELPESAKDLSGEIYYGLAGIASFKASGDLPLIRTVALWAAAYHLEQPCEAALGAFRATPNNDNLPVIAAIQREFPGIR